MSNDIVERLDEEAAGYAEEGLSEISELLRSAKAEITDLRAERDAAARDMRERCAKEVEPKTPRPCDCDRCSCGNYGDAEAAASWDADAYSAKIIRALPLLTTEGKAAT